MKERAPDRHPRLQPPVTRVPLLKVLSGWFRLAVSLVAFEIERRRRWIRDRGVLLLPILVVDLHLCLVY